MAKEQAGTHERFSLNIHKAKGYLWLLNYLHPMLGVCMLSRSVVSDSVIPWTVPHQAPLPKEFSRQEYWNV